MKRKKSGSIAILLFVVLFTLASLYIVPAVAAEQEMQPEDGNPYMPIAETTEELPIDEAIPEANDDTPGEDVVPEAWDDIPAETLPLPQGEGLSNLIVQSEIASQELLPMANGSYTYEVTVGKLGGGPAEELGPNDTIEFELTISVQSYHPDILDNAEFHILIREDIFANMDGTNINIVNPSVPGAAGEKIFRTDYLVRDMSYDRPGNPSYLGYKLQLNNAAATKTYFANEQLASVSCSFTRQLVPLLEEDGTQTVIEYKDDEDAQYKEVEIEVDIDQNPVVNPASLSKNIHKVYELVDANYNSTGTPLYRERPQGANGIPMVAPGDLVVFTLITNNMNESVELKLDAIKDTMPSGYSYFNSSTNIYLETNSIISLVAANTLRHPDAVELPWTADGGGVYSHTFSPPHVLAPLYPASNDSRLVTYIIGEATNLNHADRQNEFTVEQTNGATPGPGKSDAPGWLGDYDLALQTNIPYAFGKDRQVTAYAKNTVETLEVLKDTYIAVEYTITNQGKKASNVQVHAYVPKGYSLATFNDFGGHAYALPATGNGSTWTVDGTVSQSTHTAMWSDITKYKTTLSGTIEPGEVKKVYLFLKVEESEYDAASGTGIDISHFYVAGEISSFLDENESLQADDIDSWPDDTPYNDLVSNLDNSTVYPITDAGKEKHTRISERARLNDGVGNLQDEDDFDYFFIKSKRNKEATESYTELTKRRMATSEINLTNLFDNWTLPGYLKDTLNAVPLPDNGIISNQNNYMIYEIWVNREGLLDTKGFTLEDELPRGLKFVSFPASNTYSAIRIKKYEAIERVPNPDGTGDPVISYAPGAYAEHDVIFNNSTDDGNLNTNYLRPSTTAAGITAKNAGLYADMSPDGGKLTLSFRQPPGASATEQNTECAYKITAIVMLDSDNLSFEPMKNSISMKGNGQEHNAEESGTILWSAAGGISVIQKHARLGDNDPFVTAPTILDAIPDEDGNIVVTYRLRFRSLYHFRQGLISVEDVIPVEQFDCFVDNKVEVSGFEYEMNGNEIVEKAPIPAPLAMSATISGNKLTFANTLRATRPGELYYAVFKVKYKNWEYGETIENSIGTFSTLSTIPLRLTVRKADATTDDALRGYEFKAYYAGSDGDADISRPLQDVYGKDIVFTDTMQSAMFRPDSFVYGVEGDWDIVLMETKAPAGYEKNKDNQYTLHVHSNAAGKLEFVGTGGEEEGYIIEYTGAQKTITATLYNEAGETYDALTLCKQDAEEKGNMLPGAEFTLTRPDGQQERLVTDADGRAAIALPQEGYAGTYTLVETKAPDGYLIPHDGEIRFEVNTLGKIVSTSGDKSVFIDGVDRTTLTVKNWKKTAELALTIENSEKGSGAKTSDDSNLGLWMLLLTVCVVVLAIMIRVRSYRKEHSK
ncbi:prealbumin-like fold domain-containing protein [Christensenellaceae bacterium OttesenSCG-928-K19]|nr:prealbumin-like fold domain-containing protein [Christensenellaceae bacterium OttesenSCG-928-K19]